MPGSKGTVAVENILHMNHGKGESSYSNNSIVQKSVAINTLGVLEEAIKNMCNDTFPECLKIADLGCSSGRNSLFVIYEIINIVHGLCKERNGKVPDFQVFLNDLPTNDFNSIFESAPTFSNKLRNISEDSLGHFFICGVPGSFYKRLFPGESLNFVHSSSCLQWLSQVPDGLENNKGSMQISERSPPNVFDAYLKQFQMDFSTFFHVRSEEIIPNGRMFLTFLGRNTIDPTSKEHTMIFESLEKSLFDMVDEGLVQEADIDSFNVPIYLPYKDEVEDIVRKEGSFTLDRLEILEFTEDNGDDTYLKAKFVANNIRSVFESLLASHFGNSIMDSLFERFAKHMAEYLSVEKLKYVTIVISLTKT